MPQKKNYPDYVQYDIDKFRQIIQDAERRGIPIDPSMFSSGLAGMYKPYSRTAYKQLTDEELRRISNTQPINTQTPINTPDISITNPRPDIQPVNMAIPGLADYRSGKDLPFSHPSTPQNLNPNNIAQQNPALQPQIPPILQGAKTTGSKSSKMREVGTAPSRIKIDAPFHDLVDMIHGAINPDSESEAGSEEQVQTIPYQQEISITPDYIQRTLSNAGEEMPLRESLISPEPFPESNNYVPPKELSPYERLSQLLLNPPLQSAYKPSKLRRFGGALVGGLTGAAFGPEQGVKQAQNILSAPYREAYQDWATRTGALEARVNLDIARQKARSGDTQDYLAYLKELREQAKLASELDPEFQGELVGAKTRAEEREKEPGRKAAFYREQAGKEDLADIAAIRAMDLEKFRQSMLNARFRDNVASLEKRVREQIGSREHIAKLANDLKRELAKGKNQRIPPNQQVLAQLKAENDVAKSIAEKEKFDALFIGIKDKDGNIVSYRLRPNTDPEVKAKYNEDYNKIKRQIDDLTKGILKKAFTPAGYETFGIEEEDNELDNDIDESNFSVEEVQ